MKVARRGTRVRRAGFYPALWIGRTRANLTSEVDADMSMPNLPDVQINREDGINTILASIGMEELSLAHLLNAEGEKIQMALGTLREGDGPLAVEDIYRINESARKMVRDTMMTQILLALKLESVIELYGVETASPRACEGSPDLC